MPAFWLIYPNHGDGLQSLFSAISCLFSAPFSDATEPRPFWYGCQKLGMSTTYRTSERMGFEGRPLRRCGLGSNNSVRYSPGSKPTGKTRNSPDRRSPSAVSLAARRCWRSGPVEGGGPGRPPRQFVSSTPGCRVAHFRALGYEPLGYSLYAYAAVQAGRRPSRPRARWTSMR